MEIQKIIQIGENNFKKSLLVGLTLSSFGVAMILQSNNVSADISQGVASQTSANDESTTSESSLQTESNESESQDSDSFDSASTAQMNSKSVTQISKSSDASSNTATASIQTSSRQTQNVTTASTENQGNLDQATISNNQLKVSGWHATNYATDRNYDYVIVFDTTQNKEIARQQVTANTREDVAQVHASLSNAVNSGFNATFNLTDAMIGDKIQIISRYSAVANGNSDYVDYWFSPIIFNKNDGNLDTVSVTSDNQIKVTGWNACDASWNKPYRYLILYDITNDKQISSVKITSSERSDVASVHGDIYGSKQSGFGGTLSTLGLNISDNIAIVSRYSVSNTGNGGAGDHSDYWMTLPKFDTSIHSSLDVFNFNGTNQIHAIGWEVTNQSIGKPYHFIILYDMTTGKQVQSVISTAERVDVAKVYPNIKTAFTSGFNAKFNFDASLIGHSLVIVSRYSSSQAGNGNSGNHIDYWFTSKKFSGSAYSIDHFTPSGTNPLHVDGWFVNDGSAGRGNAYVIVLNTKTGKEVARQKIQTTNRIDVGKKYSNLYNSNQSGFSINIPITSGMSGENLSFVLRYSGSSDGNSDNADIYTGSYAMPSENKGSFDKVTIGSSTVTVRGWHAASGSYLKNYEYLIAVDSNGKELERVKVSASHQLRTDVGNAYPTLYNSTKSGFSGTFTLTNGMKNNYVRIIDRFTDDANGNGNYVDYTSKLIGIDIVYNVYANGVNAYIINNHLAHATIQTEIWSGYPTTGMNYEDGYAKPEGVVVHETANYGNDSVSMEMSYAQAHYENAFVHSYVSDGQIVNVANTNYKCWGSGKYGNLKFVQFEQIEVHSKTAFAKEINNAAYYTAYLLNEYDIAPSVCVNGSGTVWSHHDVSTYLGGTDHTDPDGYWNTNGNKFFGTEYSMNDFIQLVKYYFDRI